MTSAPDNQQKLRTRMRIWATALGIVAFLSVFGAVLHYTVNYPREIGRSQPIPFSHRFHAGEKQISCLMCHPGVVNNRHAGIPPLSRCMLCHERVIVAFPKIRDLREHYDTGTPVEWNQVNRLPEYVYFSHERHIRSGVDCGRCHGNVVGMDRIVQPQEFTMGMCVQCHRDNNASHDCLRCHR